MGYDIFDGRFDRPPDMPAIPVRRSLLLCSSPRSGSTLLTEALHRSGRVSCPTEYFDPTAAFADCYARWGVATMVEYVAALHRYRVNDDGLLSAKMHWYQLQWLCSELASSLSVRDGAYGTERAVLEFVFPHCRYVRVIRHDRDRQAVSWAIADQLNRWTYDDRRCTKASTEFVYSFVAIDGFRHRLDEHEAHWDALLATVGAHVLTVAYEDLVRTYADTVAAVAAHIGVELPARDVPPPRLRRQADERSEEVLERYLRDRARRYAK